MFAYGKNEASLLTADQKKKLREIVAQQFRRRERPQAARDRIQASK